MENGLGSAFDVSTLRRLHAANAGAVRRRAEGYGILSAKVLLSDAVQPSRKERIMAGRTISPMLLRRGAPNDAGDTHTTRVALDYFPTGTASAVTTRVR